jgi:hypothetical protein
MPSLSADEIIAAKPILTEHHQITSFHAERQFILRSVAVDKVTQNRVKQLSLFVDSNNLIRCNSRITNSSLPHDTIYPFLLASPNAFVSLIVMDAHCKAGHLGVGPTLALIRQSY